MAAIATWDQMAKLYNPYVEISAISVAGGIVTLRTSGVAPAFFHASASAITATGTSNPYEDLQFSWTLQKSDGGGGWEAVTNYETLTNPVSDTAVNPYVDWIGGEWCAPIREAGTYRLTLTCTGHNTTADVVETTYVDLTVTAFSGTHYWYDSVNGNDANDGKDPHGFGLTDAEYTNSTKTLTKAGAFSAYNHTAAAGAAKRPHLRYNHIYLSGEDYQPPVEPSIWLKPEDLPTGNGDAINSWTNQGSLGGSATPPGTAPTVATNALNGYRSMNSGGNLLTIAGPAHSGDITAFLVFRTDNGRDLMKIGTMDVNFYGNSTVGFTVRLSDDGSTYDKHYLRSSTWSSGNYRIGAMRFNNGTLDAYLNGDTAPVTKTVDNEMTDIYGSAGSTISFGSTSSTVYIIEALIYPSVLTDEQVDEINGYLHWKYNLQSLLGAGHTWKSTSPIFTGGIYEIASKTSDDAIVLSTAPIARDMVGVTSSSGPKVTIAATSGDNKFTHIRGGSGQSYTAGDPRHAGSAAGVTSCARIAGYDEAATIVGMSVGVSISLSYLDIDDIVVSDIAIDSDGGTDKFSVYGVSFTGVGHNWYLDHCSHSNFDSSTEVVNSISTYTGCGVWACDFDFTDAVTPVRACILGGGTEGWFFVIGGYMAANLDSSVLDHHIYPSGHGDHRAFRFIDFGYAGNGSFCINDDAGDDTAYTASYQIISDNNFTGAQNGLDISGALNERGVDGQHDKVVVQRNAFHCSLYGCFYQLCDSVTIRDNAAFGSSSHAIWNGDPGGVLKAYSNAIYGAGIKLRDTNAEACVIRDNKTHDPTETAYVLRLAFDNATFDIQGNTYYAPNDANPIYDDTSDGFKTFAEYESAGWTDDTYADPQFADPTNGDLRHAVAPTVTTTAASAVTSSTATSGGNVTSDGGATITARGICWSTTSSPTTADSITTESGTTGEFTSSLTGLAPGVLYYVRAYATNSEGTSYGTEVNFMTHQSTFLKLMIGG